MFLYRLLLFVGMAGLSLAALPGFGWADEQPAAEKESIPARYQPLAGSGPMKLLAVWGGQEIDSGTALSFLSADGRLSLSGAIASDFFDPDPLPPPRLILVVDAVTGKVLRELALGEARLTWLDLRPDGQRVVALTRTRKGDNFQFALKAWNPRTGKEVASLVLAAGRPLLMRVFPSGEQVLVATEDGGLTIYNLHQGKPVRHWKGLKNQPTSVAISSDGKLGLTGSETGAVQLWDLNGGKEIHNWASQAGFNTSVAFSADGKRAFAASFDQTIKVWDTTSGKEITTIKRDPGTNRFTTLAPAPDGQSVLAADAIPARTGEGWGEGTLTLYDAGNGKELWSVSQRCSCPMPVVWLPEGMLLAGGGANVFSRLEAKSGQLLRMWGGHRGAVNALVTDGHGRLISGGADGLVKVWDKNGAEITTLVAHPSPITGMALLPSGKTLLTAGGDRTLRLWEVESGKRLGAFPPHKGNITTVVVSPDGKLAFSADAEHTIKVWDMPAGKEVQSVAAHAEGINALALSPDGLTLASGSDDNTIKLWTIKNGRLEKDPRLLDGHSRQVTSLAFAADGKRLLSGSQDRTVKVWSVPEEKVTQTLQGHGNWIHAVMFHGPDQALSASDDLTIKLWDLKTGQAVATLDLGKCGDSARCLSSPRPGEAVIGTASGVLLRMQLGQRLPRK